MLALPIPGVAAGTGVLLITGFTIGTLGGAGMAADFSSGRRDERDVEQGWRTFAPARIIRRLLKMRFLVPHQM